MAGAGVGFTIGAKIGSSVASAFQSVENRIAKTRQALGAAAKQAGVFNKALELQKKRDALASTVKASGGQDTAALKELAKVSVKYREAKAAAEAAGAGVAKWSASLNQAKGAMAGAEARLAKLNALQREQANRAALLPKAMGIAASAYAMAKPMQTGLEFEAAMSRVRAISGATGEDLKKLTAQARELGGTTVWSAKEAAEGMTFLSMAGFDVNKTMAAMPGMLSLASAGGTELGQTADIASNILSGFKFKAEQMGYVSDVLAKTFTRSNTSLQSLGESFKYCGPAAANAGQSFQDTAAMIARLGDAGVQGSEAGTGLNAIIGRMAAPPKMAATALQKLGISIADASGKMKPMPELFKEINDKTKDMGEAQKIAYAKALFGTNHFAKGLILMSACADAAADGSVQKLSKELYEEGYATKVAKDQTDNLSGDLKGLNSATEELQISLFTAVAPALRALTQWLTEAARSIGAFTAEHPVLVRNLALVAAGFVAVKTVGLALALAMSLSRTAAIGTALAMQVLNGGAMAAALGTKALSAGMGILNAIMSTSPLGIIVKVLTVLAGVVAYCYNAFEPFRNMIDGFFAMLREKFPILGKMVDGVKKLAGYLGFGGDDEESAQKAEPDTTKAAPSPEALAKQEETRRLLDLEKTAAAGGGGADHGLGEFAEDGQEDETPAMFQSAAKASASGGGGGAVSVPVNITIGGMPAQDFANGVMNAIQSQKDKLERVISDIVSNQMRVAYGQQ